MPTETTRMEKRLACSKGCHCVGNTSPLQPAASVLALVSRMIRAEERDLKTGLVLLRAIRQKHACSLNSWPD